MATNLALDPELINEVLGLSGQPTKKAAVTVALQEYVALRRQGEIRELFGQFDWDDGYDYKAERSRS